MTLSPLESGKFIASNARHLKILDEGVDKLAIKLAALVSEGSLDIGRFKQLELNPKIANEEAVDWIFVVDALNFCFWFRADDIKYKVEYRGKLHTGYWSLCAAINRAIEEGIPMTKPSFYSSITKEQLCHIFRSPDGTEMPLIDKRLENLHQVGKKLCEKYDGTFVNCIRQCHSSAQKLLRLVTTEFPCFNDQCQFMDKTVSFHKRAQILIADIWACFEGEGLGKFSDIDTLTMFADYRIPQVLVHFGVFEYSSDLMAVLKSDQLLQYGDRMEVEIRGCSIWAVHLVWEKVKKILASADKEITHVNMVLLDHYLWDFRREHAAELSCIPFHKVRSIFY